MNETPEFRNPVQGPVGTAANEQSGKQRPGMQGAIEANAEYVASVLDIISNTKRLLILCKLLEGESNVTSLATAVDLGQSALSQHLAKLREGQIVSTRRDGQHIYYSLQDARVRTLLETLYRLYCEQSLRPD